MSIKDHLHDPARPRLVDNSEVDITDLLEHTKRTMRHEIKELDTKSQNEGLNNKESEILIAYIRLLTQMSKEEKSKLAKMSEEELEKMLNENVE